MLWHLQGQFRHYSVELQWPAFSSRSGNCRAELWLLQLPQYHSPPATGDVQQMPQCFAAAAGTHHFFISIYFYLFGSLFIFHHQYLFLSVGAV